MKEEDELFLENKILRSVYVVGLTEQFKPMKTLHIFGIFCTRQKAEKAVELLNISGCTIKEILLDEIIDLEAL